MELIVVIPIKLEFSSSVGFIHKEFVSVCFFIYLLLDIYPVSNTDCYAVRVTQVVSC
jgi:hypothetical protein